MRRGLIVALVSVVFAVPGCGDGDPCGVSDSSLAPITEEQYACRLDRARECASADECALVSVPCGCGNAAVNTESATAMEALANRVECDGICFPMVYVAAECVGGACRGVECGEITDCGPRPEWCGADCGDGCADPELERCYCDCGEWKSDCSSTGCNPIAQTGCSVGEKCAYVRCPDGAGQSHAAGCAPNGDVPVGGVCAEPAVEYAADDCLAGGHCLGNVCLAVCTLLNPWCPADECCTSIAGGPMDLCLADGVCGADAGP